MLKYSINIIWSDEDEAFLATIPEFPGLSAFGDTHEEAIQEALLAAQGMIEVLKEDNENIPEPKRTNKRNNHPFFRGSTIPA